MPKNFRDHLHDFRSRSWLFSMAEARDKYALGMKSLSRPLLIHLLLCMYFPLNDSYSHWRQETYSYLPIPLVPFKGSHRFPNVEFLKHNLFGYLLDGYAWDNYFLDFLNEKGLMSNKNISNTIYSYLSIIADALGEVCMVLARDKKISRVDYYAILDRHGI